MRIEKAIHDIDIVHHIDKTYSVLISEGSQQIGFQDVPGVVSSVAIGHN